MAFNPANLKSKLASVVETQDSITAIAQYIMFHKRQATQAAEIWAECMPTSDRKLALVYVANEIVQQSKARRKSEFVDAFGMYIPDALAVAYRDSPSPVKERIERTLKVWRDRQVYSTDYLDSLDLQIGIGSASTSIPPALQPVVSSWQKLEKSSRVAAIKLPPFESQKEGLNEGPELERLGKVTTALHTAESVAQAVAQGKAAQAECLQALKELKEKVETYSIGPSDFETTLSNIRALKKEIEGNVIGGAEDPSPKVEPLTPPPPADGDDDDYAPPVVYTAQNAAHGFAAANSASVQDDEEPIYAESSDDEAKEPEAAEPNAKSAKLDLDPKLASFLATISANNNKS